MFEYVNMGVRKLRDKGKGAGPSRPAGGERGSADPEGERPRLPVPRWC